MPTATRITAVPAAATLRANAFVEARRAAARILAAELAELIDQPDQFVAVLESGFANLADPAYREGQERVAPGIGTVIGVRGPLVDAVAAGLRRSIARARPAEALWLAERLSRSRAAEVRLFAAPFLRRSLPDDPERTWQLIRRMAREAHDWIAVDTLADLVAEGILREPYRWAELEQLVYAASPWERRLVGSAIARLPYARPTSQRGGLDPDRALAILGALIGDADPDVQKAVAWALRELARVDPSATVAFLAAEAERAVRSQDGHRAWVVRHALPGLGWDHAARLRTRLSGIRKRPGASSTSKAARITAGFGPLPDPRRMREPPL